MEKYHLIGNRIYENSSKLLNELVVERLLRYEHDLASALSSIKDYRVALADAISHPKRVIPDSADGLISVKEIMDAEERRSNLH